MGVSPMSGQSLKTFSHWYNLRLHAHAIPFHSRALRSQAVNSTEPQTNENEQENGNISIPLPNDRNVDAPPNSASFSSSECYSIPFGCSGPAATPRLTPNSEVQTNHRLRRWHRYKPLGGNPPRLYPLFSASLKIQQHSDIFADQ